MSITRSTPSVNASRAPTGSFDVDAEVEREVVARARRNAHEREVVRVCSRGDDGERSVAAGHAERIRAARDGLTDESRQSLIGAEDGHLDPAFACAVGESGAHGRPVAGLRVDEQDRPLRRIRRPPAVAHRLLHDRDLDLGARRAVSGRSPARCPASTRAGRAPRRHASRPSPHTHRRSSVTRRARSCSRRHASRRGSSLGKDSASVLCRIGSIVLRLCAARSLRPLPCRCPSRRVRCLARLRG